MITPVFHNTILILNKSLSKYNVPFDIKIINTSNLICEEIDSRSQVKCISYKVYNSPYMINDGRRVYLSNGIVTWINSNTDDFVAAHSGMDWDDDINLLKRYGLRFGKDMVKVQIGDYQYYSVDEKHRPIKCNWIKSVLKVPNNKYYDLLWVGEGSNFDCSSILGFSSKGV